MREIYNLLLFFKFFVPLRSLSLEGRSFGRRVRQLRA